MMLIFGLGLFAASAFASQNHLNAELGHFAPPSNRVSAATTTLHPSSIANVTATAELDQAATPAKAADQRTARPHEANPGRRTWTPPPTPGTAPSSPNCYSEAIVNGGFDSGSAYWRVKDSPIWKSGVRATSSGDFYAFIGFDQPVGPVNTTHRFSQLVGLCPDLAYSLSFNHRFHQDDGYDCGVDVALAGESLFHFDLPHGNSGAGYMYYKSPGLITPGIGSGRFDFVLSCSYNETRDDWLHSQNYINIDNISLRLAAKAR